MLPALDDEAFRISFNFYLHSCRNVGGKVEHNSHFSTAMGGNVSAFSGNVSNTTGNGAHGGDGSGGFDEFFGDLAAAAVSGDATIDYDAFVR